MRILSSHNSNAACPHCGDSKLELVVFFGGGGKIFFWSQTDSSGLANSGQSYGLTPCILKAE